MQDTCTDSGAFLREGADAKQAWHRGLEFWPLSGWRWEGAFLGIDRVWRDAES